MKFQLEISTDNAAFEESPVFELARIFRVVIADLELGREFRIWRTLRDINGNAVGRARWAEEGKK